MATATPTCAPDCKVRTLFLSDIHLGFQHARARELNEFLPGVEAERIVLVGDIVDALSLARRVLLESRAHAGVRTLLARQRAGARLVYIPGNHDASLACWRRCCRASSRCTASGCTAPRAGERLLVLHGDQFDGVVHLRRPGSRAWATALHDATVGLSHAVNNVRRAHRQALLAARRALKLGIGVSVRYIEQFEKVAAAHARAQGYDGVVCGHIHRANLRDIDGTLYCQHRRLGRVLLGADRDASDGELQLLRWPHMRRIAARRSAGAAGGGRSMRIALATDAWARRPMASSRRSRRPSTTLTRLGP